MDKKELIDSAIASMISETKDNFTNYNDKETADEFLEKKKGGMAIEVLIRSEGIPENIHEEAEKIQIFMQELLNKGLDQNNYVGFCYVKEQHYENINKEVQKIYTKCKLKYNANENPFI